MCHRLVLICGSVMDYGTKLFLFATFFCQAKSQLCITPSQVPEVMVNTQTVAAPQVITTPLATTTIVDNSVSTALVNALQLLIVSDIIESKLGASCLAKLLNINPVIETEVPCYPRANIAEYITPVQPCAAAEVVSPCRSVIEPIVPSYVTETYNRQYGVIEPYPYLGCSEIVTPNYYDIAPSFEYAPCGTEIATPCLSNAYIPEVVTPRNYYGVAEVISPNLNPYNSCGMEVIAPNPFAPICRAEGVITPSYNPGYIGGFNEIATPTPYNSCGEIITPLNPCGVAEVTSCRPFYGSEVATISPCNCGCAGNVPEYITPFNTFGGISEISPISPVNPGFGIPEVFTPCYGGIPEIISSLFNPGCAGIPEFNPFRPCRPEMVTPCANNCPEQPTPCCASPCVPTPCCASY